jgi:glutamate dehydrogenase
MGVRNTRKSETLLAETAAIASKAKKPHINPDVLFSSVSMDDLDLFPAKSLAAAAILAESEVRAWNGKTYRLNLVNADGATRDGHDVSILAITTLNKPFLYDSVMGEVTSDIRDILMALHPILVLDGKKPATLFSHGDGSDASQRVSHIQIHMPRLSEAAAEDLTGRVRHVLDQVQAAVGDWKSMLAMIDHSAADLVALDVDKKTEPARQEALAFITWLRDNNFTFLGMREYVYKGEGKSAELSRASNEGLGILSDPDVLVLRLGKDQVTTTPEILDFLQGPDFLIVTKANVRSVIHRRAYMDYIGIKRFDSKGRVIGELRIVGLFTSTAYTRSVAKIPLLRSKVQSVVSEFGFDPESHSGKLLLNTLEAYPRDDLFQIDAHLLGPVLHADQRIVRSPACPGAAPHRPFRPLCLADRLCPPRPVRFDRARTHRRLFQDGLQWSCVGLLPGLPRRRRGPGAFHHRPLRGQDAADPQDQLERDVRSIVTRWEDQFRAIGGALSERINVSQSYKERFRPEEALEDLDSIIACKDTGAPQISFYRGQGMSDDHLALKIFHAGEPVALSRRVPLLENLGFKVISEQTHEIFLDEQGRRVEHGGPA